MNFPNYMSKYYLSHSVPQLFDLKKRNIPRKITGCSGGGGGGGGGGVQVLF